MGKMLLLLILGLAADICLSLDNGLARTPPMGWLSWERFRCETDCKTFPDSCISEKLYMQMADKMVELKLPQYGYEYVNIDDCWPAEERDPVTGKLVADPERFPSGIAALVDYMHTRGLKLGIYEDFGTKTCAKYPGSEFFMELDANTFAEWKVDMVKFDGCNSDPSDNPVGFPTMQFYMNKTGHPMLFSCEWPLYERPPHDYNAIRKTCNMWRNYHDVQDTWSSVSSIINFYGDNEENFTSYNGPGSWADPDELVVGDFGLSYYQQKAQFGMWAMFAAPLFMSVDLRTISDDALAILTNKNVIAINQDPLGISARRVPNLNLPNSIQAFTRPLTGSRVAVAFYQEGNSGRPTLVSIPLGRLGLMSNRGYNVTEVFDGKQMGVYKPTSSLAVLVDPNSIALLMAVPV